MNVVNQDSSGLFPGRYTQHFAWRQPAEFALRLVSRGPDSRPLDNYYGSGEQIHEVGNMNPSVQERVTPNIAPGWEVSGGLIVSWLEKTQNADYDRPSDHIRYQLSWGPRTLWHNYAVREIRIAVFANEPQPSSTAELVGDQNSPQPTPINAGSYFIDPRSKTLVGFEWQKNDGSIGWAEYVDQQLDAAVPKNIGVAP